MIKNIQDDWIVIEGTNGAEIDVETYDLPPNAVIKYSEDTVIQISINQCESITLDKDDALAIAYKILELVGEEK